MKNKQRRFFMKADPRQLLVMTGFIILFCAGCSSTESTTTTSDLPTVFQKFNSQVTISVDGDEVVIQTTDIPDHNSPYFETTHSQYEAYNGTNTNYLQNPNAIAEQNFTFRIPLNPALNSTHEATPLGAIGVAVNGVVFFNQYAAPGDDLSQEIDTFDQYNGHPTGGSIYHYHIQPSFLVSELGRSALLGFLMDGFPVYGPDEDGQTLTSSDLDDYHGHSHATSDYTDGIYHYHVTDDSPYINGDGFYGTKGTVTNI
ncbi:MAG: hypothetical protein ACI9BD_001277 [Candidatus Marinamargulisbacteria bacterium]|jgi:hypothetical protein